MLQSEDLDTIEAMVAVLQSAPHLTEIEIRRGEQALTLRRSRKPGRPAGPASERREVRVNGEVEGGKASTLPPGESSVAANGVVVSAYLVGIFRAQRPAPVQAGDIVQEKQTLGQIEAMGLMNECLAPATGMVQTVLVEEGQPVEYGQPLFEISPEVTEVP